MVRKDALQLSVQEIAVHAQRIGMPDIRREQIDFGKTLPENLNIRFLEANRTPRLHSLPRLVGIAAPDLHAVHRHVAEVVHHTVAQPVTRAKQQNKHENTPRNGKAREERAELVLSNRAPDFAEVVKIKHVLLLSRSPRCARL